MTKVNWFAVCMLGLCLLGCLGKGAARKVSHADEACPAEIEPNRDDPGIGEECASDSDCGSREGWGQAYCSVSGAVRGQGTQRVPGCGHDEDCGEQAVCQNAPGGLYCAVDCRIQQRCGDGQRCGEHGHCELLHCERDGWSCGPNKRCDPKAPGNGCTTMVCEADSECDCGFCVNAKCAFSRGYCTVGLAA